MTEPEVLLDDQRRIDHDVECRRCGYNLRGLTLEGRCPECEQTVEFTIRGDLLWFQDPAWLRRIHRGTGLLFLWMLVTLLMVAVGVAMNFITTWHETAMLLFEGFFAAMSLVYLYGAWLVTAPDPNRAPDAGRLDLRRYARLGIEVTTIVKLILVFVEPPFANFLALELSADLATTIAVISSVTSLAGHAAVLALMLYARRLVLRLPDDRLARRTLVVAWGLGGALFLSTSLGLLFQLGVLSIGAGAVTTTLIVASTLGGLGMLVFGILSAVLLGVYLRRLRTVTAQAASLPTPDAGPRA